LQGHARVQRQGRLRSGGQAGLRGQKRVQRPRRLQPPLSEVNLEGARGDAEGARGDASTPRVPALGVGVGLRVPHYAHILRERPAVDFFEIISENFMVGGGKPLYHLDRVLESYRVIQHGVSLNIGGPDAIDRDYLTRLKALVRRVKPSWV